MFSGVVCSLMPPAVLPSWGLLRNVTSGPFLEADQLRGKINFLSAALCVWAPRYRELSMKSVTSRKKHFRLPPPKLPTAKSRKRRGGVTVGVGFASRLSNIGGGIIGPFTRDVSWYISGWISFAFSFLEVNGRKKKRERNTALSRQHLVFSESIRADTHRSRDPVYPERTTELNKSSWNHEPPNIQYSLYLLSYLSSHMSHYTAFACAK